MELNAKIDGNFKETQPAQTVHSVTNVISSVKICINVLKTDKQYLDIFMIKRNNLETRLKK